MHCKSGCSERGLTCRSAWRRFQLLTRISAARSFAGLQGRRHTAAVRLLALHALFLANPSPEALGDFYTAEPDFVQVLLLTTNECTAIWPTMLSLRIRPHRPMTPMQLPSPMQKNHALDLASTGGAWR